MDHLIEKTLSSKEIFKGRVIDLYVEEVELPNGKTSTREIVKHPGAVAVIAITPENKILMVQSNVPCRHQGCHGGGRCILRPCRR